MKRMNKKAFTIVELVIVIAVIAVLAAVLIPTFSGIVNKAKESAALQEVKQAYTEALADDLSNGDGEDLVYGEDDIIVKHENGTYIKITANGEASVFEGTPEDYTYDLVDGKFVLNGSGAGGNQGGAGGDEDEDPDEGGSGGDQGEGTPCTHVIEVGQGTPREPAAVGHTGTCKLCNTPVSLAHKYVITEKTADNHTQYCNICRHTVESAHSWGTYTYNDATHSRTCGVSGCGYVLEEVHTYVNGVCECGKHEACSCDTPNTDGVYSHNATHHWQDCKDCGGKVGETAHSGNCACGSLIINSNHDETIDSSKTVYFASNSFPYKITITNNANVVIDVSAFDNFIYGKAKSHIIVESGCSLTIKNATIQCAPGMDGMFKLADNANLTLENVDFTPSAITTAFVADNESTTDMSTNVITIKNVRLYLYDQAANGRVYQIITEENCETVKFVPSGVGNRIVFQ